MRIPAERLGEQVLVIQRLDVAASLRELGVIQGGGSADVDVGAGVQAESSEHALLTRGEVLIGQVEGRRY